MLNPRLLAGWWRVAYLGAVALIMTWVTPLQVSVDGYLYIQSSVHVFTDTAATGYLWIREPLYPLIIRAVRDVAGSADTRLILAQALACVVAAQLFATSILPRRPRAQSLAIVCICLNPITMMYVGSVLQAIWITLMLACYTKIVAISWVRDRRWHPALILVALAVTIIVSSHLAFQLGYLGFGAGLGVGAGLVVRRRRFDRSRARAVAATVAVALAVSAAAILVARAALVPWNDYKTSTAAGQVSDGNVVTDSRGLAVDSGLSPQSTLLNALQDPIAKGRSTFESSLMLLSLDDRVLNENTIYATVIFSWPCGALHEAFIIPETWDEARTQIQPSCRRADVTTRIARLIPLGYAMIQISGLALIASMVILLLLRRLGLWLVLFPTVQLIAMYAVINFNVNRYGFPAYAAGACLCIAGADWLYRRVRLVERGWRRSDIPRPSASD